MKRRRRRRLAVAAAATLALATATLSIPASAAWGTNRDYTETRYPVVLVPGVFGFDTLFGAVEYFFGVPAALRETGTEVYTVNLSAFAASEARGEQLLQQLRYISALSGAPKLNVIAHSQGGIDARYALAARPDLFASLTTVGAPHEGSPVADYLLEHIPGPAQTVSTALADGLGALLNLFGGGARPQDSAAALRSFSTPEVARFNARYPAGLPASPCGDGPASYQGAKLFSWGGSSAFTNPFDPTDYPFGAASFLVSGPSDGLVAHCSAHFGVVIRDDYPVNHGDEVNQVLGLVNFFGASPISMFRTHVNRLKNGEL